MKNKEKVSTTKELAEIVYEKLQLTENNVHPKPSKRTLNFLFEILFYTSLKTEEGRNVFVTVSFVSPEFIDPLKTSFFDAKNKSQIAKFDKPIPLTVSNLTKLSKSADPWSTSLAIHQNPMNELFVWGLIDQSIHYQSYLNYESRIKVNQPGLFQILITGIGSLEVLFEYELLATLKQSVLINRYVEVFKEGPIFELIEKNSQPFQTHLKEYINIFPNQNYTRWQKTLRNSITESLSRLLLKIQNYRHGGAFIITDGINSDIDIKYKITYDRLYSAIISSIESQIYNNFTLNRIKNILAQANTPIPSDLFYEDSSAQFQIEGSEKEINGVIRFVSSLSGVDGVIVLSGDLKVKGYGAVLKIRNLPKKIYISTTAKLSKKLKTLNPVHYGTRHQSIISYCWNNLGSIGFIVSQDGDIKAVTRVSNKLILWENIKLKRVVDRKIVMSREQLISARKAFE